MRMNIRDYINHLKELHHELNKDKQPTKQIKVQKLKLKDKLQTEIKQFGRHDKEFRNALAIGS
mgnify:CR=1 FL=1